MPLSLQSTTRPAFSRYDDAQTGHDAVGLYIQETEPTPVSLASHSFATANRQ